MMLNYNGLSFKLITDFNQQHFPC